MLINSKILINNIVNFSKINPILIACLHYITLHIYLIKNIKLTIPSLYLNRFDQQSLITPPINPYKTMNKIKSY